MLYPYEYYEKAECSLEERRDLIPLFEKLIEMTSKARRKGLLSLEDGIKKVRPVFLRNMLQLTVDGIKGETIKECGLTSLSAGQYKGLELLKRMMILDWVLTFCEAEGIDTEMNEDRLGQYLGSPLLEEYLDKREKKIDMYLAEKENQISEKSAQVEKIIGNEIECHKEVNQVFEKMDSRSIQRVLRELNMDVQEKLIWLVSERARERLISNVSRFSCWKLLKACDEKPWFWKGEAAIIQNRVFSIIRKLNEQGEVVL